MLSKFSDIVFEGQGIDVTTVRNWTDADADTEVFNMHDGTRITIRDMTISAGGPPRSTSEAIDFDNGRESLVERVEINASRAKGIIFDGKGTGWAADFNVVRDCVISGLPGEGIELLAASNNLVEGCTITDVGGHGIQVSKASPSTFEPNKKSNGNVIRNNVVDNAGHDGINVNSGDGNHIEGNRITNSANLAIGDGIRISSSDSITCDDNVVQGNVATDTQAAKTQRYGLNISSSLCNRTTVGGGNDFGGNRVAPINDLGSATQYGADTLPPTAPSGLTATGVYKSQIDLTWTASTDTVGVTGYDIWRDGSPLATIGPQTTYSDATVPAGSTHSYAVRARDAAGNPSGSSNMASATTPKSGLLFHDGFESGDLSKWTSASGLTVQQQELFAGSWAAQASVANSAAFATKHLAYEESSLYWRLHFKVLGQSTNANLLRFRTAANASLLTVFVSTTNKIGYRNDVAGLATTSTVAAARGTWHTLQVHVLINGEMGQTEVWLDGTKIDALSRVESLGTSPIGRLELGDSSTTHSYDITLDEVDYDRELISDSPSLPLKPGRPTGLNAAAVPGENRVNLSWTPPADGTGVTGYRIYRDGAATPIGSVDGAATSSYTDSTIAPATAYTYTVTAVDGAGHESDPSDPAVVKTADTVAPGAPSGLAATAVAKLRRVDLSWTAATDNVGVTGYRIWRNGAVLTTTGAVTSYVDAGVAPLSHYDYNVQALDATGTPSRLSNTASVDTPAGPPTLACWPFREPPPVGVQRCK